MAWCWIGNQLWPQSMILYAVNISLIFIYKCRYLQLDESTARRQLKSPRSLSGRSIHLTLVTKWSRSWSWMTYCHTLCAMSISPPILRYIYFKGQGQGHVSGQRSRSRLTFKFQRSRLWSRSNPLVTFEAWSSIDMFAFRFVVIRPLLAEI